MSDLFPNGTVPPQGSTLTMASNGDHLLVIPPDELRKVDAIAAEIAAEDATRPRCEQCGEPFDPRKGSGGKRQRFCSTECRQAFHAKAPQQPKAAALPAVVPPPAPTREFEPDFDWGDDDCVIVESQAAVAVYCNEKGAVVIRQERAWCDEGDHFVVIDTRNVPTLINKLRELTDAPKG